MRRIIVFFAVLLLSGCVGRTYVAKQTDFDFDVSTGEYRTPEHDPNDHRRAFVWEIELGKGKPEKQQPEQPSYTENTESSYSESTYSSEPSTNYTSYDYNNAASEPAPSADKTYTEYTIQKNDTLQKISKKFYGTTRKWQILYEENRDVLKGPDKVYPGITIKLPNE